MSDNQKPQNMDEYVQQFPEEIQAKLQSMRQKIQENAPNATEKISYAMPTFYQEGNLVHFAAYKNHIGFYPTSSGTEAFEKELSSYQSSKGALQFPIDQPLPLELIGRIVQFRVEENLAKAVAKSKKKK